MRKRDLEKFKKMLLDMKAELERDWEHFEEENLGKNLRDQVGQVSSFTTHPADMSTVIDEQERAFLLAGHEKEILNAIDRALKRIEDGTYGKCVMCGADISIERLKAIPYAEYCIECQEKIEMEELIEKEE